MAHLERDEHGELVLIDPDAVAMARAVEKHNCKLTFEMHGDRIAHYARRTIDRGDNAADVLIVVANVDDRYGSVLADALMPGADWSEFRERGETPFALGLAGRPGVQDFLDRIDEAAGKKLQHHAGVAVVVVDRGVAEIFSPDWRRDQEVGGA